MKATLATLESKLISLKNQDKFHPSNDLKNKIKEVELAYQTMESKALSKFSNNKAGNANPSNSRAKNINTEIELTKSQKDNFKKHQRNKVRNQLKAKILQLREIHQNYATPSLTEKIKKLETELSNRITDSVAKTKSQKAIRKENQKQKPFANLPTKLQLKKANKRFRWVQNKLKDAPGDEDLESKFIFRQAQLDEIKETRQAHFQQFENERSGTKKTSKRRTKGKLTVEELQNVMNEVEKQQDKVQSGYPSKNRLNHLKKKVRKLKGQQPMTETQLNPNFKQSIRKVKGEILWTQEQLEQRQLNQPGNSSHRLEYKLKALENSLKVAEEKLKNVRQVRSGEEQSKFA